MSSLLWKNISFVVNTVCCSLLSVEFLEIYTIDAIQIILCRLLLFVEKIIEKAKFFRMSRRKRYHIKLYQELHLKNCDRHQLHKLM
jgi:hypothetical protein